MTEEEIIEFAGGLPGVDVLTASEGNGAPEVAWGHSFFYYDPDRDIPADKRFPFATIVTSDYPGFDEASKLDRDGVFRAQHQRRQAAIRAAVRLPPGTTRRARGRLRLHRRSTS